MPDCNSFQSKHMQTDAVRQGTLVNFHLPYAVAPELCGWQRGLVVSTDGYNQNGLYVFICPLFASLPLSEMANSLKVKTQNGSVFLRPDLMTVVGKHNISPIASTTTKRPILYPLEIVRAVAQKFIDIITPTPEKLTERSRDGFLCYGQVGWFQTFPRPQELDVTDAVPVLCLSPAQFRNGGVALVTRSHSRLEGYIPQKHVAVALKGLAPNYFSITSMLALSTDRLSRTQKQGFLYIGERAMRGVVKKMKGIFDEAAHQAVVEKYCQRPGTLPPYIEQAIRHNQVGYRGHRP